MELLKQIKTYFTPKKQPISQMIAPNSGAECFQLIMEEVLDESSRDF